MPPVNPAVEGLMAQMRENYLRELPEKFNEIESLVLEAGRDRMALESLFRATHSLKGTAGTYGFGLISNICHNLEDCFSLYRDVETIDDQRAVALWLRYVDLLRDAHAVLTQGDAEDGAILSAIERLRQDSGRYELRGLLVVESTLDQAVIQGAFGEESVSLVDVHDGLQALERLLVEGFDFYILGNQLPRLNGLSIITAVRSNSGINRHTPCVLLSASSPELFGRQTDPDFVVTRDHHFVERLEEVSDQLLARLRRP